EAPGNPRPCDLAHVTRLESCRDHRNGVQSRARTRAHAPTHAHAHAHVRAHARTYAHARTRVRPRVRAGRECEPCSPGYTGWPRRQAWPGLWSPGRAGRNVPDLLAASPGHQEMGCSGTSSVRGRSRGSSVMGTPCLTATTCSAGD